MTDQPTDHVTVSHRPTWLSGTVAVLVAVATLALVGPSTLVAPLGVEFVGLATAVGGLTLARRGRRLPGLVLAGVGVTIAVLSVAYGASLAGGLSRTVAVLPGMFGVAVVAAAVAPLRGSGSRGLLKAGATGLLLTVLVLGLLHEASFPVLLVGTAGTVLTWDAGEHATNVGEQLGRDVATYRSELVHLAGSVAVAAVAVGLSYGLQTVSLPSLSLTSFTLVLVGALLFTAALHD
ncbi:DUF7519 family protein [Haloarchaeobius baliensis]|uniref:DUF7519 family protein n=1 Tax=Haloarchaeobius baliensis TaxID=1670458 RepID=UPI003F8839B2